jgi:hypothetical protein
MVSRFSPDEILPENRSHTSLILKAASSSVGFMIASNFSRDQREKNE